MEEFTNIFKALSDKTRLRIMWLLSGAKYEVSVERSETNLELCVCEIMDSLNESQYNVSRHLKELKNAGLIRERKEGRWVFYSLTSPISRFQELILQAVLTLPEELLSHDKERLKKRLSLRKDGKCVVGMRSEEWRKMLNQLMAKRRST